LTRGAWWNRRFTLVEMCLVAGLAALAMWALLPRRTVVSAPELAALEARYGPTHFSQFGEEWIVRDFFRDKRDGFFVDVGAGHYRMLSTTYFLEKNLNWSGLAIEPQRQFEADYKANRPNTRFLPFFVSDVSNEQARLYALYTDPFVTSADKGFTDPQGRGTKEFTAPTITLDDLLAKENVTAIDFLSMDIELSEPKALAGFDIDRFRPALVCIEIHQEVRQQIFDYFARHRYVLVGKYLHADDNNAWFAPLQ
jgi:FkbM family methyltransferase